MKAAKFDFRPGLQPAQLGLLRRQRVKACHDAALLANLHLVRRVLTAPSKISGTSVHSSLALSATSAHRVWMAFRGCQGAPRQRQGTDGTKEEAARGRISSTIAKIRRGTGRQSQGTERMEGAVAVMVYVLVVLWRGGPGGRGSWFRAGRPAPQRLSPSHGFAGPAGSSSP